VALAIVNRSKVINCMSCMKLCLEVLHVYIKNLILLLVIVVPILCRIFFVITIYIEVFEVSTITML